MMFTIVSATVTTVTANSDTNPDGYTIHDALDVLKELAGIEKLTPERIARLDVNGDGLITIDDALAILRMLAGMESLGDYLTLFRMISELHSSNEWRDINNGWGMNNWVDEGDRRPWADSDDAAMGAPTTAPAAAATTALNSTGAPSTTPSTTAAGAPAPDSPEPPKGGDSGKDFSDTNNQVEGVQESDIVKTDGKLIFVAARGHSRANQVSVVQADNGKMNLIATITGDNNNSMINEMLLYNDKLIVVWSTWCISGAGGSALVEVYNTKGDFSEPTSTYSQEGIFHSARMIDNNIYLITNFRPNLPERFNSNEIHRYVPAFTTNNTRRLIPAKDIVLPEKLDSIEYTVIGGLDVNRINISRSVTANLGSTCTIYASLENVYLTRTTYKTLDGEHNPFARWWGWSNSTAYTIIDKFAVEKGKVEFTANVMLEGSARNQFHFDEFEGNLRVVTEVWGNKADKSDFTGKGSWQMLPLPETKGWWDEQNQWRGNGGGWWSWDWVTQTDVYHENAKLDYDNDFGLQGGILFTLDENMNVLSEVHRIGFGENVQSVRFMGELAYIVTFWQTDPLFAFDLSNPMNPVLLGELKIPGFSQYMHSWSDGLLLGMGVDTTDDGIRIGLKMTMFDVSNNENLIEKHVQLIGSRSNPNDWNSFSWTYSPYEHDHRAVLVDSRRNIIGFPYHESNNNGEFSVYAVYSYDSAKGFTLIGEIKHEINWNNWNWNDNKENFFVQFERGLFIDDYIYAIADSMIISAELGNTLTEVQRLVL
jgi:uncharacterized secreted protein with C-terminal beta-propeller domain